MITADMIQRATSHPQFAAVLDWHLGVHLPISRNAQEAMCDALADTVDELGALIY